MACALLTFCSWALRLEDWTATTGGREFLNQGEGAGLLELDLTTAAFVLVALEGVYSDALSSDRPLRRFFCGNFGLLLLSQASSKRVKHLLRRMLATTVMRGAQSAGLVTYRKSRGIRHRVVNGKRTDLTEKLLRKAGSVTEDVCAPQLFQGHTRFATSSIADLGGTHPHQWTPHAEQLHWSNTPTGGGVHSATVNVEAYITHNGDLDFFEIHGVVYPLSDVQKLLTELLHSPMPCSVDSMCVAGLLELLRTQGLWRASVRFGYVYGALRDETNLAALCASGSGPSRLWSQGMLEHVTAVFEHTWSTLVAKAEGREPPPPLSDTRGVRPGLAARCRSRVAKAMPAKMAALARTSSSSCETTPTTVEMLDAAEKGQPGSKQGSADACTHKPASTCVASSVRLALPPGNAVTMAALSAPMIAAVEPLMQELLLDGDDSDGEPLPPACRSVAAVSQFVEAAVHAFVTNDLYAATRQLLSGAKGSFGLVTSHSLDARDSLVVASRGQTMSVAVYPQMGVVLFGSEAAATKVGMGQSINADLIDGNDLATLQHDEQVSTNSSPMSKFGLSSPAAERRFSARQASRDSSGMAASPITSPTMLRASLGDTGAGAPGVRPPPKAGENGVDVAAEVRAGGIAVAAASGQTRGMSRAKRRAEQFGVRVPMTGDTLEASLQMHCEVSGAGYAIYWTRSGDQFVIAADFVTVAHRAALTSRGITNSLAQASHTIKLDTLGKGPVATCYRTGQPGFVPDARTSTMKRAALAAKYNNSSICLIPFEGGVLEFGTATDGSTADWGGKPPPLPQIPSKQLHRAYEALGAGYAVLWQLQGDKLRIVAGHTSAARMLVRSDAHGDSTSFEAKSRGLELDAKGSGPVATALRSGREVFVSDVPNSSMKRAALAKEYDIKSIHFTPIDVGQYVLECGVPATARLTGSILDASLTMRCDVSGAAYAMYWVEENGCYVVAGSHTTKAHADALAAKGLITSFAEASRGFRLPATGKGPVATVARTAQPLFIADARNSHMRRQGIIEQYSIRSICLVSTEGGVLEFGNTDDGSSKIWREMPQCPDMPKAELRAAFAAGAVYVLYWALSEDVAFFKVKANYTLPERVRSLRNLRGDNKTFASESCSVKIPASGEGPIASAALTGQRRSCEADGLKVRKALAAEFNVGTITFVPCPGGVLEYGVAPVSYDSVPPLAKPPVVAKRAHEKRRSNRASKEGIFEGLTLVAKNLRSRADSRAERRSKDALGDDMDRSRNGSEADRSMHGGSTTDDMDRSKHSDTDDMDRSKHSDDMDRSKHSERSSSKDSNGSRDGSKERRERRADLSSLRPSLQRSSTLDSFLPKSRKSRKSSRKSRKSRASGESTSSFVPSDPALSVAASSTSHKPRAAEDSSIAPSVTGVAVVPVMYQQSSTSSAAAALPTPTLTRSSSISGVLSGSAACLAAWEQAHEQAVAHSTLEVEVALYEPLTQRSRTRAANATPSLTPSEGTGADEASSAGAAASHDAASKKLTRTRSLSRCFSAKTFGKTAPATSSVGRPAADAADELDGDDDVRNVKCRDEPQSTQRSWCLKTEATLKAASSDPSLPLADDLRPAAVCVGDGSTVKSLNVRVPPSLKSPATTDPAQSDATETSNMSSNSSSYAPMEVPADISALSGISGLRDAKPTGIMGALTERRNSLTNTFKKRRDSIGLGRRPSICAISGRRASLGDKGGDGPTRAGVTLTRAEELEDFGDLLKQSFRYDLDDLNGEVVLLRWGETDSGDDAEADSSAATVDMRSDQLATLEQARGNDVKSTLMRYGPQLSSRLVITTHVEGKDNSKLPSPLRRLLQLDGSPFVTPLPPSVHDPVGRDLMDLPAVLSKIQSDWDQPQDSLNRMSAWTFTYLLRKRMRAHDDNNHDGSVDLLITGCEVSLWVGEQFAADLHRVFPKLKIVTLSANKLLGHLGQSFPIPQTNYPFHAGSHNLNNSICLLVSHSGGTFGTLACSNLLKSFTQHIFCVTSEWDTQVARSIRQGIGGKKSNSLQVRSYVFVTHVGLRPAEPCTISVVATHQLLTQILLYVMVYLRHFDADGVFSKTCGSSYVREEVHELAQLNEANIGAVREIIGGPVENADGKLQIVDTPTSSQLRAQGRRWAQHVLEGPISWMLSAIYIAGTVVGGATPLTLLVAGIRVVLGNTPPVEGSCSRADFDYATASAALVHAAGALNAAQFTSSNTSTNITAVHEAALVLSQAASAMEGHTNAYVEPPEWVAVAYVVAVLDSIIYLFLPWWTTVLLRLVQGRPWLHRVAGRSVLIGDVPYVAQSVEAFASKLFALAYKNASISVASGNPADHLVHRHTHRVVRGCLLAVGRPDGRLNGLASAENTVCLSLSQASSIQNYGVTCESISIGHNPHKLSLSSSDIRIVGKRPTFLCERELELERSVNKSDGSKSDADESPSLVVAAVPQAQSGWLAGLWRRVQQLITGRASHVQPPADSPPSMSASAMMGALEGLCQEGAADANSEPKPRWPAAFQNVVQDLTSAKAVRDSVRAVSKRGTGMVKRIEPLKQPFLGAWMATSPEFRKMSTSEAFARQRLVQELYESRFASMQRLVSFYVLFHEMGKTVQDFWPSVSFGLLGYDMSRTQSIMRIATTASPVSGMEVRQRVLQLQRERELTDFAKLLQASFRFRRALEADDDQLMQMMMKGDITQAQLATLVARRAGTSPERRNSAVGNLGFDAAARGLRSNMAALTVEQRRLLTDAFKKSSVLSNLGPQRMRAAIEFFQPCQWETGQTVMAQGEMGSKLFIIETGTFDIFLAQQGSKPVNTLKAGALFGEISLLHSVPHSATVRCRTPGSMWSLDWKVLKFLTQGVSLRKTDLSVNVLQSVQLLRGLTEEQLDVVATEMELVELGPGEEIASQGNLAEAMYIVLNGGVVLSRRHVSEDGEDADVEFARLHAPSLFGDHSLDHSPAPAAGAISESPRSKWRPTIAAVRLSAQSPVGERRSAESPGKAGASGSPGMPGSSSPKATRPPTSRRKPPPIWQETITTNADAPVTRLLWISRERFVELVGHLPEVLRRNAIERALDELPIFSNFDTEQRRLANALFDAESFAAGTTIYSQGDTSEGMSMHILLKGTVRLSQSNKVFQTDDEDTESDDESVLREVSNAGESFGEAALSTPVPPRAETVVATSAVEVISLSRKAIAEMPRSTSAIAQHEQQRRRRERRRQHALTLSRSDLEALAFLGKGTFGRVQLVRRRGTDEVFALKTMSKRKLVEARKVQNAINEKRILDMLEHPFCNSLATVFSDADPGGDVHLLLDVCLGGELFGLLRLATCFDLPTARFYGACVSAAIIHLHEQCIAYRDLKPENLVLDSKGYIKMIDFGFAKVLRNGVKTFTLCGTPQYLAPELVTGAGHTIGVDWWAFGILLFEMLNGAPPFDDVTSMGVYQKIMGARVIYPPGMRAVSKDLAQRLLESNPTKRIGHQKVRFDPFFRQVDFDKLERKVTPAPWVPSLKSTNDASYFADAIDEDDEYDEPSGEDEKLPGFLKDVGRLDSEFSQL